MIMRPDPLILKIYYNIKETLLLCFKHRENVTSVPTKGQHR